MIVELYEMTGNFAANKDVARKLREEIVLPCLSRKEAVIFDFDNINGATQSFVHALVAEAIRQYGDFALDELCYKNVNNDIIQIISMVYHYMQESLNNLYSP